MIMKHIKSFNENFGKIAGTKGDWVEMGVKPYNNLAISSIKISESSQKEIDDCLKGWVKTSDDICIVYKKSEKLKIHICEIPNQNFVVKFEGFYFSRYYKCNQISSLIECLNHILSEINSI